MESDVPCGWWEGAWWKEPESFGRIHRAETKPRRRPAECIDERTVPLAYLSAHRLGGGVDQRSRSLLRSIRLEVRILSQDASAPEGLSPGVPDSLRGFGFDKSDQRGAMRTMELGGQVSPAGQRGEL